MAKSELPVAWYSDDHGWHDLAWCQDLCNRGFSFVSYPATRPPRPGALVQVWRGGWIVEIWTGSFPGQQPLFGGV